MSRSVVTFLKDDEGQGLVEYALIIALISIVAIVALQFLGNKANNTLNNAGNSLSGNPHCRARTSTDRCARPAPPPPRLIY